MALNYATGQEIKKGDRVLFHREPGEIELVADPLVPDPETDWFIQEYGNGVMILERQAGRTFVSDPHSDEDLEFLARRA